MFLPVPSVALLPFTFPCLSCFTVPRYSRVWLIACPTILFFLCISFSSALSLSRLTRAFSCARACSSLFLTTSGLFSSCLLYLYASYSFFAFSFAVDNGLELYAVNSNMGGNVFSFTVVDSDRNFILKNFLPSELSACGVLN